MLICEKVKPVITFKDDKDSLKEYFDNDHYFSDEDIEYFDLINTDPFASIHKS